MFVFVVLRHLVDFPRYSHMSMLYYSIYAIVITVTDYFLVSCALLLTDTFLLLFNCVLVLCVWFCVNLRCYNCYS